MLSRLALFIGSILLLAGCAAGPDYGYDYGYARGYDNFSCGWGGPCDGSGPYSYGYGPSLSLNFGVGGDRDRGDRDRRRGDEVRHDAARAGGGERHDGQVGRDGPQLRHEGGDHGHDHHDHDR